MKFIDLIKQHQKNYPLMTIQDHIKLAYQCAYGPYHMHADFDRILSYLKEEAKNDHQKVEYLVNGYARFYYDKNTDLDLLARLFFLSMEKSDNDDLFLSYLDDIRYYFNTNETIDYLKDGIRAISHSDIYRLNYQPHYRLIKKDYASYYDVIKAINDFKKDHITIAIDGRCASGKSELANILSNVFDLEIVHMDDFYLPKNQRKEDWFEAIAGNMNLEYFKKHVLGDKLDYQKFDCQTQSYYDPIIKDKPKILLIEGTYSLHPQLIDHYDLKIFLKCSKDKQILRLLQREIDIENFTKIWIKKETDYFEQLKIIDQCDLVINTDDYF